MKDGKFQYGDYLVMQWQENEDDKNCDNLRDCVWELLQAARAYEDVKYNENTIHILIKNAKEMNESVFGEEKKYLEDGFVTVGLTMEGTKLKKQHEETEEH
jgi:hypothetical protein